MAKLTSKDLEVKAEEIKGKIQAYRQRYTDMVLEGKSDPKMMADVSLLETELASTLDAIDITRQREAEAEEIKRAEDQEKAKSEAGKLRGQASNQLEIVIDDIVSAVSSAVVFLQTLQKGKDMLYKTGLNGRVMDESEYYEIIANVERLASGLAGAHPARVYPGHPDLKGELLPLVNRLHGKA